MNYRLFKRMALLHPFFVCLLIISPAQAQEVPASLVKALDAAQRLEVHKSRELLKEAPKTHPVYYLVEDYNDVLELIIDENPERFEEFEDRKDDRLDIVDDMKAEEKWKNLVLAEIKFHWAIANFKYNNEMTAVWNLNQSHGLIKDNLKDYPDFVPNLKTMGIFHIVIGALPNNYQWVLGKLGFKGDVQEGLNEMERAATNNNIFRYEAKLVLAMIKAQLLGEYEESINKLNSMYRQEKSLSLNYLLVSLYTNSNQAEKAIELIRNREQNSDHLKFAFYHYKLASCYFQKAEYGLAIDEFNTFVSKYKGKNYMKSAYHKLALAHYFQNHTAEQKKALAMIDEVGWTLGDEDKYAQKFYEEGVFPNRVLSKARYLSDGGYYKIALQLLASKDEDSFELKSEKVEYCYRKARIYDMMDNHNPAKQWYEKTIEKSEKLKQDNLYFAPNACLKLGIIYMEEGDNNTAKKLLKDAISYKGHEYENSIEMKSKSLLEKID